MVKLITKTLLKKWNACEDGYKRFIELFPKGADLQTAIDGLVADGHDSWGKWLFERCRENGLFSDVVLKGYRNSGYRNSGDGNSGNWNSGNRNSGNWNSGNRNTGYFNTTTEDILVFNKPCKRSVWENATKPDFLLFSPTVWVSEDEMTDQEKVDNKHFYVTGGYLKTIPYKEAFKAAWDKANKKDRELVKRLPNFDADIFFEISGIRVGK